MKPDHSDHSDHSPELLKASKNSQPPAHELLFHTFPFPQSFSFGSLFAAYVSMTPFRSIPTLFQPFQLLWFQLLLSLLGHSASRTSTRKGS